MSAAPNALVAAWLIGAAIGAILIVWRQGMTLRLLGRLRPDEGGLLRAANPAVGPAVVGVLRPKILLPSDFETRFDLREQILILAHEQAHVRAGDVRINALVAVFRCLAWFNPLVHVAASVLKTDQELACDAAVVTQAPGERRAYANALLKTQMAAAPLPLGCYWPARAPRRLKLRIRTLAGSQPDAARRSGGAVLVAMLAMGVTYAAWGVERPEPIVRHQLTALEDHAGAQPVAPSTPRAKTAPSARAFLQRLQHGAPGLPRKAEPHEDAVEDIFDPDPDPDAPVVPPHKVTVLAASGTGLAVLRRLEAQSPDADNVVRIECRPTAVGAARSCIILPGMAAERVREWAEEQIPDLSETALTMPQSERGLTFVFRIEAS